MAEIIQMYEKTWRIEDGFVRFFLVEGNEKAVMIDSGVSSPDAKKICESLTKLPIILLNTHGDGDHTAGTAAFDEIYIRKEDFYGCGVNERYPKVSLREINDGEILDLGGRTLKIVTIPGHTKGSVAILDVEGRRLFAGDSVQTGNIYMFGEKRSREGYADSLKKLVDMSAEYDFIIASHSEPVVSKDYAEKVLDSWTEVLKGRVSGTEVDLFGMKVKLFATDVCGFYL